MWLTLSAMGCRPPSMALEMTSSDESRKTLISGVSQDPGCARSATRQFEREGSMPHSKSTFAVALLCGAFVFSRNSPAADPKPAADQKPAAPVSKSRHGGGRSGGNAGLLREDG